MGDLPGGEKKKERKKVQKCQKHSLYLFFVNFASLIKRHNESICVTYSESMKWDNAERIY